VKSQASNRMLRRQSFANVHPTSAALILHCRQLSHPHNNPAPPCFERPTKAMDAKDFGQVFLQFHNLCSQAVIFKACCDADHLSFVGRSSWARNRLA